MKNRICSTLAVIFLAASIFGCAEQTKGTGQKTEGQQEAITEPVPLIIEPQEPWKPHGVFEGTVVISGEGMEDISYEGVMYIEPDGKYIRISCTGAVRSRYGELF